MILYKVKAKVNSVFSAYMHTRVTKMVVDTLV